MPALDERGSRSEPTAAPAAGADRRRAELAAWRGEVRTAAIAAAGGLVAGAATVAAVARASRGRRAEAPARSARAGAGAAGNVVASRSFLVDVHLLGDASRDRGARPRPAAARGRGAPAVALPAAASRLGGDGVMRAGAAGSSSRLLARRRRAGRRPRLAAGARRGSCCRAGAAGAERPAGRASARARDRADALRARRRRRPHRVLRARFRGDPLLGAAIRHRPWHRPRRRPWPWEALAWAVTEQLIEAAPRGRRSSAASSAAGATLQPRTRRLARPGRCATCPAPRADRRPRPGRARRRWTWRRRARRAVRVRARGRRRPGRSRRPRGRPPPAARSRRSAPGPCSASGFFGRGEPDSLPAGDLAYVKLVGRLAGLGRRATVEEVEEFFAPYAPFRGLAGRLRARPLARVGGPGPAAEARGLAHREQQPAR